MNRVCLFLVVTAHLSPALSASAAPELWNFQFTPNGSLPMSLSGDLVSARADVAGTFTLRLDWQRCVGQLVKLEGQLVNVFDTWGGNGMQPSQLDWGTHGIVAPYQFEEYLEGPFTFENGMWKVTSTGWIPSPGGIQRAGLPYTITFNLTQAWFNMIVPIDDAYVEVTSAPADFINATITADFNGDLVVDAADYVTWRKMAGTFTDFNYWRQSFGGTQAGAGGGSSVPEPTTAVYLAAVALMLKLRRKSRL